MPAVMVFILALSMSLFDILMSPKKVASLLIVTAVSQVPFSTSTPISTSNGPVNSRRPFLIEI